MMSGENRKTIFDDLVNQLISVGVSTNIFSLQNLKEPEENISIFEHQKTKSTHLLLGHLLSYTERYLKVSSKPKLSNTHALYTRESRKYWCESSGILPGISGYPDSKKNKGLQYEDTTVLNLEQAVTMLCYLFRFKLEGAGSKTKLEKYKDVAIAVILDFLDRSICENVSILKDPDVGLGD